MKFDFIGWILAIIIIIAQFLHQGIPSLTRPTKSYETAESFITTTLAYLSLRVTVFKDSIKETAALNFVNDLISDVLANKCN